MTRELAEHWLVVRTDQENSGSVHSKGAGIDNLAGMVEQSGLMWSVWSVWSIVSPGFSTC